MGFFSQLVILVNPRLALYTRAGLLAVTIILLNAAAVGVLSVSVL